MAFIGALPAELRNWFASVAGVLEGRKIIVACSGGFSIEQIISLKTSSAEIWGNDVSLYSSVLGCLCSGQELPISVADKKFEFISDFLKKSMTYRAATILALSSIINFSSQKNDYQRRMWHASINIFERYVDKIATNLDSFSSQIRLSGYTMQDGVDVYPQEGAVAICFPPTYTEGYERMFKKLESALNWPKPEYQTLTPDRRKKMISNAMQMDYIIFDDRPHSGVKSVAVLEKIGKKKVICFSNLKLDKSYTKKKILSSSTLRPLLMPDHQITEDSILSIAQTSSPVFNHYRNLFLSKRVTPSGGGGQSLLFLADGKIFGAAMFLAYSVKLKKADEIYLMSDFCVPSSFHRRLSKLVLLCLLSSDVQKMIERKEIKKYTSVLTSVFTSAPVSMKYRGIFELVKRGDNFLNYRGNFNGRQLQEVLDLWLKKYEKR